MLKINKKLLKIIYKNKILLGHNTSERNYNITKYILFKKNNIDIINPIKYINLQNNAEKILQKCAYIGGKILFLGTKKQISYLIKKYAKIVNMPYINNKWPAGLLSNIKITKFSINKKKNIKTKKNTIYNYLSKKEKLLLNRKYKKINKKFGSIINLNKLPLFIIIVDIKKEFIALKEAIKSYIYIIGIIDTNCSTNNIDYPIIANDDSYKSVKFILKRLTLSIIKGFKKREKKLLKYNEYKKN
ncbi:MAG: hypothetical protein RDO_0770 [Flavobacteriales endosymbiont of Rhyzopertha dominica]|nr:MAG: 30S ribosomal protein S2 [Candidatus Shikimatogenerans bostrichidophilus]